MSIEIATSEDLDRQVDAPPPPAPEPKTKKTAAKESKGDDDPGDGGRRAISPEMKALRSNEDKTLKDLIESLGNEGSFKIRLSRSLPETVKDATGKLVPTSGFLEWVHRAIDEEWVQNKYGGGKYELFFRKKGPNGGWEFGGQRTIDIAGEPNLGELPRSVAQAAAGSSPPAAPDGGPILKATVEMFQKQLDKAEERAEKAGTGRGDDGMLELLRDELKESRRQLNDMVKESREVANRPPVVPIEDKVKDRWLEKLMDQDTVRLQAVRVQYESELRQAKESAIENERRLRDGFDRDKQSFENGHRRELDLLNNSHASNLASSKASYDMSLAAAKSSFDTQKEIMSAENRRLDRDNAELRADVKELRAKKEKTIVEQFKDIQTIKDAIGVEDEGDKGVGEKAIDAITNPDVIAAVGKLFGKDGGGAPPQAQPAPATTTRPRVVQDKKTGAKFILGADGKSLRPVHPKETPGSTPGEPPMPFIPPDMVEQVVGYLERAYAAGTDPDIVAQSGKAMVPEPVLVAIRDVGGVDVFLAKVAKLPSSSPLSANLAGRNWVKKVGKALVGE